MSVCVPTVCDLGLSYRITRSHVTRATTVGGTAAYVSPEHLRNEPFSEKMDIWSFGVTMLEIITRTRPHGELRDYAQVIQLFNILKHNAVLNSRYKHNLAAASKLLCIGRCESPLRTYSCISRSYE